MLVIEKIRENLGESREGGPMKDHSRHESVGDSGVGRARRPVTMRYGLFGERYQSFPRADPEKKLFYIRTRGSTILILHTLTYHDTSKYHDVLAFPCDLVFHFYSLLLSSHF